MQSLKIILSAHTQARHTSQFRLQRSTFQVKMCPSHQNLNHSKQRTVPSILPMKFGSFEGGTTGGTTTFHQLLLKNFPSA